VIACRLAITPSGCAFTAARFPEDLKNGRAPTDVGPAATLQGTARREMASGGRQSLGAALQERLRSIKSAVALPRSAAYFSGMKGYLHAHPQDGSFSLRYLEDLEEVLA
jgi:hypothetical protein